MASKAAHAALYACRNKGYSDISPSWWS